MITKKYLEYQDQKTVLEAFLAYDENVTSKRPAVLVVHGGSGRDTFADEIAEKLAHLGCVGLAIDMFGKNILCQTREEKLKYIKPLLDDRALLLQRVNAGFELVKQIPLIDQNQVVIIGYCFGGMCALDLARSGANIKGAVCFHGMLTAPNLPKAKILAKILALQGYADPQVPPAQITVFQEEMTAANADWQMHVYGHVMHAFTLKEANSPESGVLYDAKADQRSWQALQDFLREVFS